MKITPLLPLVVALAACRGGRANAPANGTPSPNSGARVTDAREAKFVDSLLSIMSIEEKVGQFTMSPAEGLQTGPRRPAGSEAQLRAGQAGSVINIVGVGITHALQKLVVEQSPHRIPVLFSLDVIHGYRTVFPFPLAEAASFDPKLAESNARIAATEAAANGITWTFAPMVDIARDPRWGRIMEGAGEEPYLGAVMAAARARGFQGTRLNDPSLILATAKHYAGYGVSEGGRDYATAESASARSGIPISRLSRRDRRGRRLHHARVQRAQRIAAHASAWMLRDVLWDRLGFGASSSAIGPAWRSSCRTVLRRGR